MPAIARVSGHLQNFSLTPQRDTRKAVSFAENRNSDDIVIYFGTRDDFNVVGNFNEKVYSEKKFFGYEQYNQAAKFIAEFFGS